MTRTYTLKPGVIETDLEDELVLLDPKTQGMFSLNATGRVVAQRRAAVSSKATGRLEALFVQEGQFVRAGLRNRDFKPGRMACSNGVAAGGLDDRGCGDRSIWWRCGVGRISRYRAGAARLRRSAARPA